MKRRKGGTLCPLYLKKGDYVRFLIGPYQACKIKTGVISKREPGKGYTVLLDGLDGQEVAYFDDFEVVYLNSGTNDNR